MLKKILTWLMITIILKQTSVIQEHLNMWAKNNRKLLPIAKQLRKEMTKEERRLWFDFLREYPVKFYRQKIIGNYIVDFYCAKAKLVVELDGSQHFENANIDKDKTRTKYLNECGLTVMRIPNNQVNQNFRGVCEHIDNFVRQRINAQDTEAQSEFNIE